MNYVEPLHSAKESNRLCISLVVPYSNNAPWAEEYCRQCNHYFHASSCWDLVLRYTGWFHTRSGEYLQATVDCAIWDSGIHFRDSHSFFPAYPCYRGSISCFAIIVATVPWLASWGRSGKAPVTARVDRPTNNDIGLLTHISELPRRLHSHNRSPVYISGHSFELYSLH